MSEQTVSIPDNFLLRLEKGRGMIITSILCGLLLLGVAALMTTPRWELFYHGKGFSELSKAPFDFSKESPLRYRILAPLLGYLFFLKGPLFKYFMLAVLCAFYSLLYFFLRRKDISPFESLGIGALLSLSTLSFYQLHFPAYTDPVSYVLILILLFNRDSKWLTIFCLILLLFNHENSILLFPFFFLWLQNRNYSLKNFLHTFYLFIPALSLYLLYRILISSMTDITFSSAYYFDAENLRWTRDRVSENLLSGTFQSFRLTWLFLLFAVLVDLRQKRYHELVLLFAIVAFVLLQFFVAYDISRLTGLAFPAIILSVMRTREFVGSPVFSRMVWLMVLLNCFVPSYCIGALEPIAYPPFWWPGLRELMGLGY